MMTDADVWSGKGGIEPPDRLLAHRHFSKAAPTSPKYLRVNICDDQHAVLAPRLVRKIPPEVFEDSAVIHLIRSWGLMPEDMKAVIRSMANFVLPNEPFPPPGAQGE